MFVLKLKKDKSWEYRKNNWIIYITKIKFKTNSNKRDVSKQAIVKNKLNESKNKIHRLRIRIALTKHKCQF